MRSKQLSFEELALALRAYVEDTGDLPAEVEQTLRGFVLPDGVPEAVGALLREPEGAPEKEAP